MGSRKVAMLAFAVLVSAVTVGAVFSMGPVAAAPALADSPSVASDVDVEEPTPVASAVVLESSAFGAQNETDEQNETADVDHRNETAVLEEQIPVVVDEQNETAVLEEQIRTIPAVRAAAYDIDVVGGELPFDPALVFARVEILLGVDVDPPTTVVIEPPERMTVDPVPPDEFDRLLGMGHDNGPMATDGYFWAGEPDRVVLNERILRDEGYAEAVYAHEAIHFIQWDTNAFNSIAESMIDAGVGIETTDGELAFRSTLEGTAIYGEDVYWHRYLAEDETWMSPSEQMAWAVENTDGRVRLALGIYHYGYSHVDARVDDATQFDRIYHEPPRTTSEVLHGREDDAPLLEPLSVDAETGSDWDRFDPEDDRLGELYLRSVLADAVGNDEAAPIAEGWTNDQLVAYDRATERSYVWAIRTEDADAAATLEDGFEAWLEANPNVEATEDDRLWTRTDEDAAYRIVTNETADTVVIALGHTEFVTTVDVAIEAPGEEVSVEAA